MNEEKAKVVSFLQSYMDELEQYFREAPIDYDDRKRGLEEFVERVHGTEN